MCHLMCMPPLQMILTAASKREQRRAATAGTKQALNLIHHDVQVLTIVILQIVYLILMCLILTTNRIMILELAQTLLLIEGLK